MRRCRKNLSADADNYVSSLENMAARAKKVTRKNPVAREGLSVANQLFAITTRRYSNAAAAFLPEGKTNPAVEISNYQAAHAAQLKNIVNATATEAEKSGKLLSGTFGRLTAQTTFKILSRAALFVVAIGAGLTLVSFLADDTIRIEDE